MAKLYALDPDGRAALASATVGLSQAEGTYLKSPDGSVERVVALERADYDALAVKDPKTLYHITDEV
jgi:hypothetical protein